MNYISILLEFYLTLFHKEIKRFWEESTKWDVHVSICNAEGTHVRQKGSDCFKYIFIRITMIHNMLQGQISNKTPHSM